jgi:serine/threonine-protein kinase
MIGHVVGSYRILSRLGAGGMGTVWLAEHTLLGRRVAIKFLHAEISRNASTVERFFAEARSASRISDPGIIVVYDFGWHTDGSAYIVMEHLDGESLAARLTRVGRLPLTHAIHAMEQAAMAMAVAHAAGIIHRDLKPDNIFLIPDPVAPGGERIKLLDFGIAKLVNPDTDPRTHARTHTGLIMGTPMYMSPEQCRGAGNVDHRTDIYALGCVFFHLICGREPFMAITPGDLIAAHLREAAPAPSIFNASLPASIDHIILRCLAKSPDARYASMTELVRDLRAAIGLVGPTPTIVPLRAAPQPAAPTPTSTPLSTLGTSAGESLPRSPTKRRHGLTVAVLLTAAIGTMIGVVVARRNAPTAHVRAAHGSTGDDRASTMPTDGGAPHAVGAPALSPPTSPRPAVATPAAIKPAASNIRTPAANARPTARPVKKRRADDPLERR